MRKRTEAVEQTTIDIVIVGASAAAGNAGGENGRRSYYELRGRLPAWGLSAILMAAIQMQTTMQRIWMDGVAVERHVQFCHVDSRCCRRGGDGYEANETWLAFLHFCMRFTAEYDLRSQATTKIKVLSPNCSLIRYHISDLFKPLQFPLFISVVSNVVCISYVT